METGTEWLSLEHLKLFMGMLLAFVASSGFWMFIDKRVGLRSNRDKLIMGLAHDRILDLSIKYLERGYITRDEYENLCVYLYTPYLLMGGNGTVKRIMLEVEKLPIEQNTLIHLQGDKK